jgi:hypothetical protein
MPDPTPPKERNPRLDHEGHPISGDDDRSIDEDAPGRSLIDEDEDAVEPNEPG